MSDAGVLRFGNFELHLAQAELRLNGDPVRLPPQPLKVLEQLARRSGEVLTRNEIREHVWCGDTFVDFEQGLNFCIRQIREALGDDAGAPRFVETLPRRGYRFLMPVTEVSAGRPVKVTRLIVLPFRTLKADPDTDSLALWAHVTRRPIQRGRCTIWRGRPRSPHDRAGSRRRRDCLGHSASRRRS